MRAPNASAQPALWRHLGLTFFSPWSIGIPQPVGTPPDVRVVGGDYRDIPDRVPNGEVVAERLYGDRRAYTIVKDGDRWILRMHRRVDFVVRDEGRMVECHQDPRCPEGLVEGHLVATVSAFLLALRGFAVLHASCVEIGGQAVAFLGPRGAGKTTCAALCCAAGAGLVADDVLAVASGAGEHPVAVTGRASELRLREEAEGIAAALGDTLPKRRTVDDRLAIHLGTDGPDTMPLAGVLLPRTGEGIETPSIRRLCGRDAFFSLASESRLAGLRDPDLHRRFFEVASTVAATVPIAALDLPLIDRPDSTQAKAVYEAASSLLGC